MDFIQAANYTKAGRTAVDLLVLHTMENMEKPGAARNVALWFASAEAPQASAHYCIDAGEVIQCVKDEDIAWHAPGANRNGLGLEHAGRAAQSPAEWQDPFSEAALELSANLAADLCHKWKIPAVYVPSGALLKGARGITTHMDVSRAFRKSDHWDPGIGFPIDWYVKRVAELLDSKEAQ